MTGPRDLPVAAGMLSVLVLFYGTVVALAADLKVPPRKPEVTVRAWICGYTSGFEDGLRQLTDPKAKESEQCQKYREEAKKVLK